MTTYYTFSGVPIAGSRGVSSLLRTEFTTIQTAFATVNTEMTAKGAIAGQVWTGVHNFSGATSVSVPTPSSGSHAVNKTYADSLAMNAALPAQTGNSGKSIITDGSNASWGVSGVAGGGTGISSYTIGDILYASGATTLSKLAASTAGYVLTSGGAGVAPSWARIGTLDRRAITTTDTVGTADIGNLIDCTSGTFTLTFAAAATLGDKATGYIQNSGTGDVTLEGDGAETVDGLTNYIMYPGEVRQWYVEGSTIKTIVVQPFYKTFTASGTFTKPPGYSRFGFNLWGAGGSGRKDSGLNNKTGGCGGSCAVGELPAASVSTTETITIGSGGAAQTVNASDGNAGGNSSIGSLVTAYGGAGGVNAASLAGPSPFISGIAFASSHVLGGSTTNAPAFLAGGGGNTSTSTSRTIWGGAAGGSITSGDTLINDASTVFGGARGDAVLAANGTDGTAPGGGGGATKSGGQSGAGARGEARIWGI